MNFGFSSGGRLIHLSFEVIHEGSGYMGQSCQHHYQEREGEVCTHQGCLMCLVNLTWVLRFFLSAGLGL